MTRDSTDTSSRREPTTSPPSRRRESTDDDTPPATPDRSTDTSGPALLEERSLLGIFVHPIALFVGLFGFGVVAAGLVYRFSSNEFTRENARNALNWHLSYLLVTLGLVGAVLLLFGLDWLGVPDLLLFPVFAIVFAATIGSSVLFLCTLLFGVVATAKAIFGDAWRYPVIPELVE